MVSAEGGACVVTGANRGIGKAIALDLAQAGRRVILACRDMAKAKTAADELISRTGNPEVEPRLLDLDSFASVRAFAEGLARDGVSVEALVNNAGVLRPALELSADGHERTMQVNYLGPFLLTVLLLPLMRAEHPKIVGISSLTYRFGCLDEKSLSLPLRYKRFKAYADSKLALTAFSLYLASRVRPGISVSVVDPGIVNTGILNMDIPLVDALANALFRPLIRSPASGAGMAARLALMDGRGDANGAYYVRGSRRGVARQARDPGAAERLVARSLELVGLGPDALD